MKALLISKHEKELCLRPAFSAHIIPLEVFSGFDTDELGTFSGTITRKLTPLDAAMAKAKAGRKAHPGFDWYIGSEGSFFPDSYVPFVTRQHELLLALPADHEMPVTVEVSKLIGWAIDQEVMGWEAFLNLIEGPFTSGEEHLFLSLPGSPPEERQAAEAHQLKDIYHRISQNGTLPVQVMSDLRAHRSRNRRLLIEEAAELLVQKLITACPNCQKLGYGMKRLLPGLPCAWCLNPTSAPRAQRLECVHCGFSEEKPIPGAPPFADPGNCGNCNP